MDPALTGRSRRRGIVWRGTWPTLLAFALALGPATADLADRSNPAPGPAQLAAATPAEATLLFGEPADLDPARQGDIGSARVGAQLFESLTALDPGLNVRPALAESWDVLDGGQRIVFHLRPALTYSDGSPLGAADVVRSWLRIIDPANPSPLASLMADVDGAEAYLHGQSTDPGTVGLRADGTTVEVRLRRPATDFPAIVASATFAIVPPAVGTDDGALQAGAGFVASGAYVLARASADELTMTANPRYWVGTPAITTVHLKTTLGGGSPVDAFQGGDLDYTPVGEADAGWIRYDRTLGPSLRTVSALAVTYYGFDTSRPPFDNVRVRQAFGSAIDWRRIVSLAGGAAATPANSLVPPGIPGRSERDFVPAHDPAAARAALAAAGYPAGKGFPDVTLVSGGSPYDEAIVADLERELGITVHYEGMESGPYFSRLSTDPPAFWALGWVADYPGPNDFLGLLLGTGSTNNYGRWSSPEFDAAIGRAVAATDPASSRAAFDDAEAIVLRDVPVVPVAYDSGSALARQGLLGAAENGLGILRLAGLAWSDR